MIWSIYAITLTKPRSWDMNCGEVSYFWQLFYTIVVVLRILDGNQRCFVLISRCVALGLVSIDFYYIAVGLIESGVASYSVQYFTTFWSYSLRSHVPSIFPTLIGL